MNIKMNSTILKMGFSNKSAASLESELIYQGICWNEKTTSSKGLHSDIEFLVFIEDYLREAMTTVSRGAEPAVNVEASHNIRKITAMAFSSSMINNWIFVKDNDAISMMDLDLAEFKTELKSRITVTETLFLIKSLIVKAQVGQITNREAIKGIFYAGLNSLHHNESPLRE